MEKIIKHFNIQGELLEITPFGNGHINDTFLITIREKNKNRRYILQRMNSYVFKKPEEVMENVGKITTFLRQKIRKCGGDENRETLSFLKTEDGLYYVCNDEGDYWRICWYVEDTMTYEKMDSPEQFFLTARAFGYFQNLLCDYPAETLYETIPNFHHTIKRYQDFEKSVQNTQRIRYDNAQNEVRFLLDRKELSGKLLQLLERKELPLRVTHNDTKINNLLFDKISDLPICVIDLDTVMPGLAAYDFGDLIRTGASTAGEDERNLELVHFDITMYEACTKGFLGGCGGSLTKRELETLPFGALVITYEQALRFLTDYLNGDVYYKVTRPLQNLDRTRTQIRLLQEMEEQFDKMMEVVTHGF